MDESREPAAETAQSHASLKALLDTHHTWPGPFVFKFIVPKDALDVAVALLPDVTPELKPSGKGNYLSVTFRATVASSEAVLAVYERARAIPGVIAL
jgi:putative lipoic acid-binding regulatory protein